MTAAAHPLATYLVELYLAGAPEQAVERVRAVPRGARLERWVYLPGDETCFLVFRAPSAESVELTLRMADVAFERVVPAVDTITDVDCRGRPANGE